MTVVRSVVHPVIASGVFSPLEDQFGSGFAPTSSASSISQDGVNITLDTSYQVGQHVDDTYFVIADSGGEVVISSWEVDSGETVATYKGGVMVDPADMTTQGFDNRTGPDAWYDAGVNESLPLTVDVSDGNPKTVWFYRGFGLSDPAFTSRTWGYAFVQVTVYASSNKPLANPIKPPGLYVAGGKPMLTTADINYNAVTPVAVPAGASEPDWDAKGYGKRPKVFWGPSFTCTTLLPYLWQEDYNGTQAPLNNDVILGAISNSADRVELINRIVRDGMEVHASLALNNKAFIAAGGHGQGWKALRFFAGIFLEDSAYLESAGWVAVATGALFSPAFAEDNLFIGAADGTYTYGKPIYGQVQTSGWLSGPPFPNNHVALDPAGLRECHWIAHHAADVVAGGATSVTLSSDSFSPAIAANYAVRITAGPGAEEVKVISAWDSGTKVATVSAWSEQPDNTSDYEYYNGAGGYQIIVSYGIVGAAIAAVAAGVDDQWDHPPLMPYFARWFAEDGIPEPYFWETPPSQNLRNYGDSAGTWAKQFYDDYCAGNWPAQTAWQTTLSSPTGTKSGSDSGSGTVVIDNPLGTLYWFVSTSATPPSATDLKAGTGAADSGSVSTVKLGAAISTGAFSGLSPETTYYVHYLHRNLGGVDSAIATSASFTTDAAPSYVQNWVDTQDTAYLSFTGVTNNAAFSFGLYVDPTSVTGFQRLIYSTRIQIHMLGAKLGVMIKDSANTIVYEGNSTGNVFTIDTACHIEVSINLSTPEIRINKNGVGIAMTPSQTIRAGNGLVHMTSITHNLFNEGGGANTLYAKITDLVFDPTQFLADGALYNGGTPPDPTTFSAAAIILGGDMTADARGAEAAQGWNDGYSLGSISSLTVGSGTFADV